jgi:hypothetical protein
MSAKPTSIMTTVTVDTPLVQSASYSFDAQDRQYIDTQIRGCQQQIVDCVLRGVIGTWVTLDGSSVAVVPGDVVCLTGTAGSVTKGVLAAMTPAGCAYGVVLQGGAPNTLIRVAEMGYLAKAVTGLGTTAGFLRVNTTTARLERVATISTNDYPMGIVMATGDAMLLIQPISAGTGGIGTDPTANSFRADTWIGVGDPSEMAPSGDLRLDDTWSATMRDGSLANTGTWATWNIDGSDILGFGHDTVVASINHRVKTGGKHAFLTNNVEQWNFSANVLNALGNSVIECTGFLALSPTILYLDSSGANEVQIRPNEVAALRLSTTGIGYHGTAPTAKPTITGSRGGNAALADLLTKLAATGFLTDGTSA